VLPWFWSLIFLLLESIASLLSVKTFLFATRTHLISRTLKGKTWVFDFETNKTWRVKKMKRNPMNDINHFNLQSLNRARCHAKNFLEFELQNLRLFGVKSDFWDADSHFMKHDDLKITSCRTSDYNCLYWFTNITSAESNASHWISFHVQLLCLMDCNFLHAFY
jgi:hypothetical protein